MAHLSLSLLGPFQATLDEESVPLISNRLRALLAYLAVESKREHRRQALAGLLWPKRSDREARASLRYALSHLHRAFEARQAQPSFLCITRHTVQFNCAIDFWLDVDDFTSLIADSRLPVSDQESQTGNLKSAIGLYRGEFLEGLTLDDSPAFEEWLLLRREQFRHQALTALRRLAALHELRGEYEPAMTYVRRFLALDPWDEAAHRRLMRLLAQSRQRTAALAQYETCRQVLAHELGVAPEDDTTHLYERIRRGEVVRVAVWEPASPSPPPGTPLSAAPFVARQFELARLDGFLELTLAGQGRVALIRGEAGSGKTLLLDQFARRSMERHSDVVAGSGKCNAHAGLGDPYLPFREAIQMLTGDIEAKHASGTITAEHARRLWTAFPDAVQAVASEGLDLLDCFLSGDALALRAEAFAPGSAAWRTRLEELGKRQAAGASLANLTQTDLFEQVTRTLQSLARQHPLILVLDDLQWADSGTISLLFHLGRRLAGHRILLVGAYRPADLASGRNGERHPLEPILNELQREFGDVQVDLNQADGRRFVDGLLDAEPNHLDQAFRETLFRHTGGNPLFTVELLHGLRERGNLVQDEAGQWVVGPHLDWERLPAQVEAVIAERFGRLPADWRQMLTIASVEGEVFAAEVVTRVLGADEDQIIQSLSGPLSKQHRLVAAHSLQHMDGRRFSCYRFRHVLFQNYLYQSLDDVERARLHEAVGTELETLYGEHVIEISGQLARHFEAADMIAKAVNYWLQTGNRAVQLSDNRAAIACFDHGLDLLDTLPETSERDAQEVALRLALHAPLVATESYASPRLGRSHAQMQALCQRMGDTPQLISVCAALAGHYSLRAEFTTSLANAEKALALAERYEEEGHVVWAQQVIGLNHLFLGNLALARKHMPTIGDAGDSQHRAMRIVRGTDPRISSYVWNAWILWLLGYPDQAQQRMQSGVRLARALDHAHSLAVALLIGGIVPAQMIRELDNLPGWLEELEAVATEHQIAYVPLAHFYQDWLSARKDPSQGPTVVERMRQALDAWLTTGMKTLEPLYLSVLADACLVTGQWAEAQRALDTAQAIVGKTQAKVVAAELHRLQGELLVANGKDPGAEACFERAVQVARQQQARSLELRATIRLAHLYQGRGQLKKAWRLLAEIYGWFTEGFDTPDLQEAKALLGKLEVG